jgi:hypothetical protein
VTQAVEHLLYKHKALSSNPSPTKKEKKICKLDFTKINALDYTPTSNVQGFLFPTSSPTPVVGGVFDDGYSNRGEVDS